jgi:hypothetical protein
VTAPGDGGSAGVGESIVEALHDPPALHCEASELTPQPAFQPANAWHDAVNSDCVRRRIMLFHGFSPFSILGTVCVVAPAVLLLSRVGRIGWPSGFRLNAGNGKAAPETGTA